MRANCSTGSRPARTRWSAATAIDCSGFTARARRRWTPRRGTVGCNKPRRPWPSCKSDSPDRGRGFASAGQWNRPWRGFWRSRKSRRGWPCGSRSGRRRRFARPRRDARPNAHAYVKHTRPAYSLSWELQHAALIEAEHDDGVFPLLTNDRTFDAEQVLRAYKRQPLIEKRFSQFKTDFAVAPVYLKNVARIQGLLTIYFLVLLTQTLLERELRRAMARANVPSLPMYPEGRPCTRPTTCRIVELFAPIQRHVVRRTADQPASLKTTAAEDDDPVLVTTLTPVQRKILRLLGLTPAEYGH